jgi:hypothetical protein
MYDEMIQIDDKTEKWKLSYMMVIHTKYSPVEL